MMKTRACALYLRVSTDRQALKKEGSLEEQEQRLRASLLTKPSHESWLIHDVYREEGQSGKDTERPELRRLRADIREGKVNTVLVTKLDRLTRSLIDFYELHKEFEHFGVDFISLDETFDTSTSTGRAMLKITLVFAELERERTSERVKTSMRARAERGLWNGNHPILGYDIDPEEKGVLQVNEGEAAIVRKIFSLYVEKGSYRAVAKALNDEGHRTKAYISRKNKSHGGREYQNTTVQKIICSPEYIGKIKLKGELFEGRHEAIIDECLWNQAQSIRESNRVRRRSVKEDVSHVFLLEGLIKCGGCGSTMSPNHSRSRGKKYFYYQCTAVDHKHKDACTIKRVKAETMEQLVFRTVEDFAKQPELLESIIEQANRTLLERLEPLTQEKSALEVQERQVDQLGKGLVRQLSGGEIKLNEFVQEELASLQMQRSQLRASIRATDDQLAMLKARVVDAEVVKEALTNFSRVFEALAPDEQKEMFRLLVREAEYTKDKLRVCLFEGGDVVHILGDGGNDDDGGGSGGTTRKKKAKKYSKRDVSFGVPISSASEGSCEHVLKRISTDSKRVLSRKCS